MLTDRKPI